MKLNKYLIIIILVALCITIMTIDVQAQCPMCRMSAESNLKNGGTEGRGLNLGILYMLSMPYLLVGTIGFLWWRHRRYDREEVIDEK